MLQNTVYKLVLFIIYFFIGTTYFYVSDVGSND